jgi:hypothetical protein
MRRPPPRAAPATGFPVRGIDIPIREKENRRAQAGSGGFVDAPENQAVLGSIGLPPFLNFLRAWAMI